MNEEGLIKPEENSLMRVSSTDAFIQKWDTMKQIASTIRKSSIIDTNVYKSDDQVMTVMMMGADLGLTPTLSLQQLFPVGKKVGMMTQLMWSLVRRSGKLETWKFEDILNDNGAFQGKKVTLKRIGEQEFTTVFTMQMASSAGLLGKKDSQWEKRPDLMCQWRALADNIRVTFNDVIQGMYTVEELVDAGMQKPSQTIGSSEADIFAYLQEEVIKLGKNLRLTEKEVDEFIGDNKKDLESLNDQHKEFMRNQFQAIYKRFKKEPKNDAEFPKPATTEVITEIKS